MWIVLIVIGAMFFWFWLSREQVNPEEAAEDALDAAENVKRKVEIKSDPEPAAKPEAKTEPKAEAQPEPKAEIKAEPAPKEEAKPSGKRKIKLEPDDLTRIEGIGPKFAEILVAAGVDSYDKLAEMSVEQIEVAIKAGGGRKSASMATWAEQAALAAKGDWTALEQLQAKLNGGKKA